MSAKATTPADAVIAGDSLAADDQRSAAETLNVDLQTTRRPARSACWWLRKSERLADQPLDYTVGMAIVNKQGRGVAQPIE